MWKTVFGSTTLIQEIKQYIYIYIYIDITNDIHVKIVQTIKNLQSQT